jgi:hypothetical protein
VARHGKDGVVSESQDDRAAEASADQPVFDTSVANPARIWNYWLGGKDNYPVDRQVGEQTIAVLPEIVDIARASRQFLARVVRYLVVDAGIRQFLDVGTGLPTVNNTHEVAQQAALESRVVYVDNDPAGADPRAGAADQQPRGRH